MPKRPRILSLMLLDTLVIEAWIIPWSLSLGYWSFLEPFPQGSRLARRIRGHHQQHAAVLIEKRSRRHGGVRFAVVHVHAHDVAIGGNGFKPFEQEHGGAGLLIVA